MFYDSDREARETITAYLNAQGDVTVAPRIRVFAVDLRTKYFEQHLKHFLCVWNVDPVSYTPLSFS